MTAITFTMGSLNGNIRTSFITLLKLTKTRYIWQFNNDNNQRNNNIVTVIVTELHSSTELFSEESCSVIGLSEKVSLQLRSELPATCVVSGGQVEVRSIRQQAEGKNFAGRWTILDGIQILSQYTFNDNYHCEELWSASFYNYYTPRFPFLLSWVISKTTT